MVLDFPTVSRPIYKAKRNVTFLSLVNISCVYDFWLDLTSKLSCLFTKRNCVLFLQISLFLPFLPPPPPLPPCLLFYWSLANPSIKISPFSGIQCLCNWLFQLCVIQDPVSLCTCQCVYFIPRATFGVWLASELFPGSLFCLVFLLWSRSPAMWLVHYLLGALLPLFFW